MFTAAHAFLSKSACGCTGKGCVPLSQSNIASLRAVSRAAASAFYRSNVVLDVKLTDKPKESLMQLVTIDNRHIIATPQKCPPGNL